MPDIRSYVQREIARLRIDSVHDRDVIEELTLELEARLEQAILAGNDPEVAWQDIVQKIDWNELAADLRSVFPEEEPMEPRNETDRRSIVRDTLNHLRYGCRLLAKNPSFTLMAVLTIALGIGANTAIFSVLYGVFWAPADNPYTDRLAILWQQHGTDKGYGAKGGFHVTPRQYLEWERQSRTVEAFGAVYQRQVTLNDDSDYPDRFQIQMYTPGLITRYGGRIALGREFLSEEGTKGKDSVAVLSDRFWRQRYKGDRNVLGKQIRLDGVSHTIVGVLQPGWWDRRREPLWTSFAIPREESTMNRHILTVVALRKPGVTLEQVQAEMNAISKRVGESYPASDGGWTVRVDGPRNAWLNERTRANLWLLMGTVSLLLLIACVNVANLLLARGAARQKEMAVRISLGATEWQVFRQLLTENLLLSFFGGIAGIGLSWAFLKIFLALLPPFAIPPIIRIELNGAVLLFTIATVLISGVVFGCAPAWRTARASVSETLKLGGRSAISGSNNKLGKALVVAEFSLALTILAIAGLAMRSYWSRTQVDLGINTENVLTFQLPPRQGSVPSTEQLDQYNSVLMDKLRAVPGVQSACLLNGVPLRDSDGIAMVKPGKPVSDPSNSHMVHLRMVSSDFFPTFDVQTLRGRPIGEQDRRDSMMVAMVNETLAREEFGSVDPVGQELTFTSGPQPWKVRIIGLYRDIANSRDLTDIIQPEVIIPISHAQPVFSSIAVRTAIDPQEVRWSIAAAVRSLDAEMPMANVRTMEQVLHELTAFERFEAILYGSFASIALLLAAVGIYSLMSFVVAQRIPEMGLRMALGADRNGLLMSVLRDGLKLAAAGLVLGAAGAYYATRWLQSSLYGTGGVDITAFATVSLILLLAAMIACLLPASRASKVDPMTSLRSE